MRRIDWIFYGKNCAVDEDWDGAPEEYDDEDHLSDEFETSTIACSNCGTDVYEEAVSCPICGEYIGVNTHPFHDRPQWWILLGIIGSIATILSLIFFS